MMAAPSPASSTPPAGTQHRQTAPYSTQAVFRFALPGQPRAQGGPNTGVPSWPPPSVEHDGTAWAASKLNHPAVPEYRALVLPPVHPPPVHPLPSHGAVPPQQHRAGLTRMAYAGPAHPFRGHGAQFHPSASHPPSATAQTAAMQKNTAAPTQQAPTEPKICSNCGSGNSHRGGQNPVDKNYQCRACLSYYHRTKRDRPLALEKERSKNAKILAKMPLPNNLKFTTRCVPCAWTGRACDKGLPCTMCVKKRKEYEKEWECYYDPMFHKTEAGAVPEMYRDPKRRPRKSLGVVNTTTTQDSESSATNDNGESKKRKRHSMPAPRSTTIGNEEMKDAGVGKEKKAEGGKVDRSGASKSNYSSVGALAAALKEDVEAVQGIMDMCDDGDPLGEWARGRLQHLGKLLKGEELRFYSKAEDMIKASDLSSGLKAILVAANLEGCLGERDWRDEGD